MFCARCGEQIPDASEICPLCREEATVDLPAIAFPASRPAQVAQPAPAPASGPHGVGGWLLFFCVVLTILGPLGSTREIAALIAKPNPVRLVYMISVPYGIAVGIMLWMQRPVALSLLRVYFIIVAATAILGILDLIRIGLVTGWAEMFLSPNFTPLLLRPAVIILWFSYFHKSRRVRNTYGANL